MRKRKLFQNIGISFLAAALAVSSVVSAAAESVTEHMALMDDRESEPDIALCADTEAETEMYHGESEQEENQTFTESGGWGGTDESDIPEETLTEKLPDNVTEKVTENQSEVFSEKDTERASEKNSEAVSERLTESMTDAQAKENGGTELTTEEVSEEADREQGIGVLTAKSEDMDMTILAPDDSAFPDGTELILYAEEELEKVYAEDGEAWDYEAFLERLKEEWKEEIQNEYDDEEESSETEESLQYLYPYYFTILDKTGTELPLPKEGQVYVNIYDHAVVEQEKTGQYLSKIGFHESGNVRICTDSDIYCNTEKNCLAVDTGAEKSGLYSLIQFSEKKKIRCLCESDKENGLAHDWDCPVFYAALEKVCDCGSGAEKIISHEVFCSGVWEAFHAACSGCMAEKEEKGMLHDDCEVVLRIHRELCECGEQEKNLEKSVEAHDEDSNFVRYVMKLADYLNSQTEMLAEDKGQMATENISKVSGWSNGSGAASDHFSAKFYAGKSSMELFGGSTVSGKWIQGSMASKNCLYWLPLQDSLADRTSHGARYSNVIYDYKTGKWYDMKFTIQAYQKTYLPDSKKTVYPLAGFYKNKLQFGFERQGPMVIRCQILEAGTSAEAKIKVKIPVWDIDDAQFVGIKQNNGSMDHRYYYSGADNWLRAKNNVSVAGVGGFFYVEGKFGTVAKDLSTPQACAVWEMTTSDFSFALGYYNNATVSETTRWDRFHIFSTNTTIGDGSYGANGSYGAVSIFSQDNTAPALQKPLKRVSSDNKTWGNSLELSSITGSYYYAIDYTVLDTIPANKFSSLVLSDTLPAGADYVSGLKVTRLEDGKNKTSWFTTSTADDKIRLTATADALAANDFYGYTYHVTFKVKMDPTEMEAIYQEASGRDTYSVSNKGTVSVKRGSTSANNDTNTVTTTASRELPVITVYKKNSKNELLSGAIYQIAAKDNITSPAGKVFYQGGAIVETITTGTDGKAVSGRLHPGTYMVTELQAPVGYALNKAGQEAGVSYLNPETGAGSAELSFVNNRLYSTIQVTKEIDTADIVWAHGNPIFTFKVSGNDTLGKPHVYYDTVEFTKANTGNGSRAALTATFRVLAGTYTVSEEVTARYQLAEVHSVANGTVSGKTAVMHVEGTQTDTEGPAGSAVFYNRKTTDGGQSHTVFVRNGIKK